METAFKVKKMNFRWVGRIVIWSLVLAAIFTLASYAVLEEAGYVLAFGVLVALILLGILFDMVGVAVTAADETPFHSMAAHKGRGAKEAIRLIKSADRVATLCSDVVGDITGIVSGITVAVLATRAAVDFSVSTLAASLVVSGIVIGLTIGGKALGKQAAIGSSQDIVLFVAKIIYRKNWLFAKLLRKSMR